MKEIKMKQLRLKLLTLLSAISIMSVFMLGFGGIAEAATCYTKNSPASGSCVPPTGDGIIIYLDQNGKALSTLPDSSCFSGVSTAEKTTYTIGDCTALKSTQLQLIQDYCKFSKGTPKFTGTADRPSFTCECPTGLSYESYVCKEPTTEVQQQTQSVAVRTTSETNDCTSTDINGDNCGIVRYLNLALNFLSGGITLAVIGNIIFAGIQYSTAQGDPSNVGKAKKRIRDALLAFAMYLGLYGFMQWLIPGGIF